MSSQPRFEDFPTHQAYEQAWYLWRAIQRDGRLNPEEHAVKWDVIEETIKNRLCG